MKIIYDFGSNNGDDVDYYLKKADLVVAVEANPALAETIKIRYQSEIDQNRLVVENCVLTVDSSEIPVPFFIHKTNHVLSQFPRPSDNLLDNYEEVILPSKNVISIIKKYGDPYYIKIDIEHYDEKILNFLLSNSVIPPYISAESHGIGVFALLVALGGYSAFKLVDGQTVHTKYAEKSVITNEGVNLVHNFPHHSAGPFGNDISGPWYSRDNFFRLLSYQGLGWKDIHASRDDKADYSAVPAPIYTLTCNF